jgi:nucleoside 2-deoxyribosyltransferase
MKLKIYLAHSLTHAPEPFARRMKFVRATLREIPDVQVLDFAWELGPEFNEKVNVYEYDMKCVHGADLVVAVLDFISAGTSMEVQARCQMGGMPLTCFFMKGTRVSKIISDCIKHHRSAFEQSNTPENRSRAASLPDPIEYVDDEAIVEYVRTWVSNHSMAPALA